MPGLRPAVFVRIVIAQRSLDPCSADDASSTGMESTW